MENRKKRGLPEAAKPFQFKKGQSGNPGGRPKKRLIDEVLEELLEAAGSKEALAIGKALIKKARKGDSKAAQLIAERTQGKPPQAIHHSNPDGGPVVFTVKHIAGNQTST